MDERASLLRSILERPHDNLPRLVFADKLEESGEDGLARFIRAQIELNQRGVKRGTEDDETWGLVCDLTEYVRDHFPLSGVFFGAYSFKERPLDGGDIAVEYETTYGDVNPEVVISRGFVSEIKLPLEDFVGRRCYHCNGIARAGLLLERSFPCPTCNATGVQAGVAGKLFSRHPVERVEVTDLHDRDFELCWLGVKLPHEIARRFGLTETFVGDAPSGDRLHYDDSRRKAREALSEKLVQFGRREAGLGVNHE